LAGGEEAREDVLVGHGSAAGSTLNRVRVTVRVRTKSSFSYSYSYSTQRSERRMEGVPSSKARIWLIVPDWQARGLVRAQRLVEGYDVTAMEDWETLDALLREEVALPQLVIAELTGDEPASAVSLLRSLPVPRLILRGARAPDAEARRAAGIEAVLSRPF